MQWLRRYGEAIQGHKTRVNSLRQLATPGNGFWLPGSGQQSSPGHGGSPGSTGLAGQICGWGNSPAALFGVSKTAAGKLWA